MRPQVVAERQGPPPLLARKLGEMHVVRPPWRGRQAAHEEQPVPLGVVYPEHIAERRERRDGSRPRVGEGRGRDQNVDHRLGRQPRNGRAAEVLDREHQVIR
jgi:hypothetical protein